MDDVKDVTGPEHKIRGEQVLEVGSGRGVIKDAKGLSFDELAQTLIEGYKREAGDDWVMELAKTYIMQNHFLVVHVFDKDQERFMKSMAATRTILEERCKQK